jgi:hypothetical protein
VGASRGLGCPRHTRTGFPGSHPPLYAAESLRQPKPRLIERSLGPGSYDRGLARPPQRFFLALYVFGQKRKRQHSTIGLRGGASGRSRFDLPALWRPLEAYYWGRIGMLAYWDGLRNDDCGAPSLLQPFGVAKPIGLNVPAGAVATVTPNSHGWFSQLDPTATTIHVNSPMATPEPMLPVADPCPDSGAYLMTIPPPATGCTAITRGLGTCPSDLRRGKTARERAGRRSFPCRSHPARTSYHHTSRASSLYNASTAGSRPVGHI